MFIHFWEISFIFFTLIIGATSSIDNISRQRNFIRGGIRKVLEENEPILVEPNEPLLVNERIEEAADAEPALVDEGKNAAVGETALVDEGQDAADAEPALVDEGQDEAVGEPALVDEGEDAADAEPALVDEGEDAADAEPALVDEGEEAADAEPALVDEGEGAVVGEPALVDEGQEGGDVAPVPVTDNEEPVDNQVLIGDQDVALINEENQTPQEAESSPVALVNEEDSVASLVDNTNQEKPTGDEDAGGAAGNKWAWMQNVPKEEEEDPAAETSNSDTADADADDEEETNKEEHIWGNWQDEKQGNTNKWDWDNNNNQDQRNKDLYDWNDRDEPAENSDTREENWEQAKAFGEQEEEAEEKNEDCVVSEWAVVQDCPDVCEGEATFMIEERIIEVMPSGRGMPCPERNRETKCQCDRGISNLYMYSASILGAIIVIYFCLKRRSSNASSTAAAFAKQTREQELASLNNMAGNWGGESYPNQGGPEQQQPAGKSVRWEKL